MWEWRTTENPDEVETLWIQVLLYSFVHVHVVWDRVVEAIKSPAALMPQEFDEAEVLASAETSS